MVSTKLQPEHCTPSCSRAAARLWPAAAVDVQCDLQALVADLTAAGAHRAALLRSGGTAVACGCDGFHMRPTGVGRGPDLRAATAGTLPPSCSRAATRPWPATAIAARCDLQVLVADPTYPHLPLERRAPSCSGAATRPRPTASMAAPFDLQGVVAELTYTLLYRSGGPAVACGFDGCSVRPPGRSREPGQHAAAAVARHAVLLRSGGTAVARGFEGCSVRPPGFGRGPGACHAVLLGSGGSDVAGGFDVLSVRVASCRPDLHATPSCSGAAARPWPMAPMVVRCYLQVRVAAVTDTQLPAKRCTPSCTGRRCGRGLHRCDLQLLVADLTCTQLPPDGCRRPAQERRHDRGLCSYSQSLSRRLSSGGGTTVTCLFGACRGPDLHAAAAGALHSVLFRSCSTAAACCFDGCSVRPPVAGRGPDLHEAAAGALHAALFRSGGTAESCGCDG